jgi:signal peptidase I
MLRELAKTEAGAEFTCDSGSMHPTIRVGETVRVRAVPRADLQVGDVVVYEGKDGIYMLHRIVLISSRRSWFLHIGDASSFSGPRRALSSAIVGRTDHARVPPKKRVLLLALPHMILRRSLRLFAR